MDLETAVNEVQQVERLVNQMRFVEDERLRSARAQIAAIGYFTRLYGESDHPIGAYAVELVIVVRRVLHGQRPTRLPLVTGFDGEIERP